MVKIPKWQKAKLNISGVDARSENRGMGAVEEGRRGVLGSLAGSRHDVMSFPFKEDVCSFDVDSGL